jgi:hypothetical protein
MEPNPYEAPKSDLPSLADSRPSLDDQIPFALRAVGMTILLTIVGIVVALAVHVLAGR